MTKALAKIDTSRKALAKLTDVTEVRKYVTALKATEDVMRAAGAELDGTFLKHPMLCAFARPDNILHLSTILFIFIYPPSVIKDHFCLYP